jgi:hypothetical protein
MPTTSNFGWTTPADTDLVKDGAAAIRTLGNGIDTSLVDLKGGTTGQVLSKASNTDLDFSWVSDATGIPATIFDAKGDLIAATAADTASRLAVGTNGHVLTADSATSTGLKWAAVPTSYPASDQATVATSQTTTSSSYTDLATSGPAVTVTTGTKALVIVTSDLFNSGAGNRALMGYAVSGATTTSASDTTALLNLSGTANETMRCSAASIATLTAGSNTFTAKYRVNTGTGTFENRSIIVINLA